MSDLLKWQENYVERITKMGNDDLFTEYEEVSIPDDYDGAFTNRGAWMHGTCHALLVNRLKGSGFLSNEYK